MEDITVTFASGETRIVRHDARLNELVAHFEQTTDNPIVAAIVNNEVLDLSRRIRINATVEPVYLASEAGVRCYRQALCYLLAMAARRRFPDRRLVIGHSLGDGYYYYFDHEAEPDETTLAALREEMEIIVRKDLPIVRRLIAYGDANELFEKAHMHDTLALLKHRNESRVPIHACDEFADISHGPLVPRTGILRYFDLTLLTPGFVLRYPNRRTPTEMSEYRHSPVLYSIYQEYMRWGRILGITSVGRLNEKTHDGSIGEFIQVNEALQEKKIADIADRISERRETVKIVLIAGPSSSGKTTSTKKLAVQLQTHGLIPRLISVDDYFVDRGHTPIDEDGKPDFESIHAIDIDLLNEHLLGLFRGDEVELPRFDFKSGQRKAEGHKVRISSGEVLLMEGIHCLNDELTPRIGAEQKFKVYVSALTQLNLDDNNRIPTTDNRLIRRMVRDYQFRGHSARDTLEMWPSVRRGERRNIFPFQDTADAAFNSALDYELGVLKKHAEPLLRAVKPMHPEYDEAVRLLSFLANFTNIPDKFVPSYSIVREFIGDSGFHY